MILKNNNPMAFAVLQAEIAGKNGEIPVGAVIYKFNLPLILAPLQFIPTCVCIEKAKSSAVAFLGKAFKSPPGVNTNISFAYKFSLKSSTKSIAFPSGFSSESLILFNQSSKPLSRSLLFLRLGQVSEDLTGIAFSSF